MIRGNELLRYIRLLTAECVDDDAARPVLADALLDAGLPGQQDVRFTRSLRSLWECVALAGPPGRSASLRCRGVVRAHGDMVYTFRLGGVHNPEYKADGSRARNMPTGREAESLDLYYHFLCSCSLGRRDLLLRSHAHCRRLAARAMDGYDVPPDVQVGLMRCVESVREILRSLAPQTVAV